MLPSGIEQLLVLDIPDFLIGPTRDISDELTEAPVWISLAQLGDGRQ
jgi:hypothetical protein